MTKKFFNNRSHFSELLSADNKELVRLNSKLYCSSFSLLWGLLC
jgi:hypothetical protein